MIRLNFKNIAHFFTLVLVILLLWASKGFLLSHPIRSAGILLLFSCLYYLIGIQMNSRFFIYPSIALFALAYFLCGYAIDPNPYRAPFLSVTLIGIFFFYLYTFNIKKILSIPLTRSIYLLIMGFTFYIFFYASHYIHLDQIVPMVVFTFYGAIIGILAIKNQRNSFISWALINISLAYLFMLYSLPVIPLWQFSLYLMIFFMAMMHTGVLVHKKTFVQKAKPFYWLGFLGLCIAPLYSIHHPEILLLIQALYALHFSEIYLHLKQIDPESLNKHGTFQIFHILIYPLTLLALVMLIEQGFPLSISSIGTCLIFSFLYFRFAREHRFDWKKTTIHLPFLGITFLTIAYLTTLSLVIDPKINPLFSLYCIPLIGLMLFIGWVYSQGSEKKLGMSIYLSHYLSVAVILAMPVYLNNINILTLLGFSLALLLIYMVMYLKGYWRGFLYSLPLLLSYCYYLLLLGLSIPHSFISISFLLPGLIVLGSALWIQQKGAEWHDLFYAGWYILSIMALISLDASSVLCGYSLALWGVIYFLVAAYAKPLTRRHRSYLMTIGHTLSFSAAFLIPFMLTINATIHVYLLIGLGYLLLYLAVQKDFYLYPVGIAGVVTYSLYFLWGLPWDMAHIGIIPLLFLIYGIWDLMGLKQLEYNKPALKQIGHLTVIFYTSMLLFHIPEVEIGTVLLSLIIYFMIYSFLIVLHKGYDILFLMFGFASLIYLEALRFFNTLPLEIHMRLFSLVMIPLCLIGFILYIKKDKKWAFPAFDLLVIISLIITLISLSHSFIWTTQMILIMSAILFMFLFLLIKKDLYIYLTTLCLGLTAYTSLIATREKFVIDLMVYTLYTLLFIGIFFFFPVIKRLLNYRGPRYMIQAINWKSVLFYGGILSGMTILFFFLYSLQLANFPGFCDKCHFMKPYAEAWAHSTHKEVNCVDCHYAPGVKPMVKGKLKGVLSVVKYVTNTYTIKPNSEINDASCLRSGCHNKMNMHDEIGFKNGIKFNHLHHLGTLKRGKQLRCTTCHSQIVQGEHLTVTESICFTCHFIGRDGQGVATGKCGSCHNCPENPVNYHGIEFNHSSFLEGKPDTLCIDCHIGVTQGDGRVPGERCYSCHTEKDPDLSNSEGLHFTHITLRKVECFECHLEIQHGIKSMSSQIALACDSCHISSHTVSEKMFLGIGGVNVSGKPDPMFTAKVSCQGCHKYKKTVSIGSLSFETTRADIKVCDECHGSGSGYTDIAEEWQREIDEKLETLVSLRKGLEKPIIDKGALKDQEMNEGVHGAQPENETVEKIFQRADANLRFILEDGSKGIHNYYYTKDLLDTIENDFKACESCLKVREGVLR